MFKFCDVSDALSHIDRPDNINAVFTRPEQHHHRHIPSSCAPETYLTVVSQNIKSEFWCLFKSLVTPVHPGWRSKRLTEYRLVRYVVELDAFGRRVMKSISSLRLEDNGSNADVDEFVKHLVLWQGRLFVTMKEPGNSEKLLLVSAGMNLDDNYPDSLASMSEDTLYSLGYIGSFVQQLRACESLRARTHDPIVQAIANPLLRKPIRTTLRALDLRVPCNAGQRDALEGFHRNIEGLQGPPGTGKSTEIFHIITALLEEQEAALVTCVQNRAVDSIAERLSRAGDSVRFFVIGNPNRLGPTACKYLIEPQTERRPSVMAVKRAFDHFELFYNVIDQALRILRKKWLSKAHKDYVASRTQAAVNADLPVPRDGWEALVDAYLRHRRYPHAYHLKDWLKMKVANASKGLAEVRKQERVLLLRQAKAVLCTVAAIPRAIDFLTDPDTDVGTLIRPIKSGIVDEAGTVSEQEVPMLLMMGAERIIAIGDQRQLPPFTYADQRDFEPVGLFQRLDAAFSGADAIPMLTEQYRMHLTIASVVSSCFYSGRLITPRSVQQARSIRQPIIWIDSPEREANDGTSKVNWGEIKYIASLVPTLEHTEIAVISFYKPQVKLLEQCVIGRANQSLSFLTVDSAQGSEYEAVILSCVRSNSDHNIGFVSNLSRLCVAFSRAKEQQFIVGNMETTTRSGCQPFNVLAETATRDLDRQRWLERQPTSDIFREKKAEYEEREAQRDLRRNAHGRGKGGRGRWQNNYNGRGKGGRKGFFYGGRSRGRGRGGFF